MYPSTVRENTFPKSLTFTVDVVQVGFIEVLPGATIVIVLGENRHLCKAERRQTRDQK